MAAPEVTRLNYYSHQYLGVDDFRAQQAYHRDMRRRHNVGPHLWGIVVGLELSAQETDSGIEISVRPGLAVDGFGRELVLLRRAHLDPVLFSGIDDEGFQQVWIAYREHLGDPPRPELAACAVEDQYGRIREGTRFLVGDRAQPTPLTVDGRTVQADAADELPLDASVPYQEFQPDVDADWPICLGRVWWNRTHVDKPTGATEAATAADGTGRRHVGLTAARLVSQPGAVELLLAQAGGAPIRFETPAARERMRITGDGYVGIGTTTPSAPLEIESNWNAADGRTNLHLRGDQPGMRFRGGGPANFEEWLLQVGDLGSGSVELRRLDTTSNEWTNLLVVSPQGHVGVRTGTDVPVGPLEVRGDWNAGTGVGAVHVRGDKPTIRFAGGAPTGNENWMVQLGSHGPGNIAFYRQLNATQWEAVLSMTPAGLVRIGGPPAVAPLARLEVTGDWNGVDGIGTLRLTGDKPTIFFNGGPSSSSEQWLLHLGSNGPGGNFEVHRWKDNVPHPVLSITRDERVGIGETNPLAKLHVNGDVRLRAGAKLRFADNGSIGSYDEFHALIFNRAANRLELREYGEIVFFTGGGAVGPPERGRLRANGTLSLAGGTTDYEQGRFATQGLEPGPTGYPPEMDWGGIHTYDVWAEGQLAVGYDRDRKAWIDRDGNYHGVGAKYFVIDHPLDPAKSLRHAAAEGPEHGVFYRGEASLVDGEATIELPPYFEELVRAEDRTVLLTPKVTGVGAIAPLAASAVEDGRFVVRAITDANPGQDFYWEVKAVRADIERLEIEPPRVGAPALATTTGGIA